MTTQTTFPWQMAFESDVVPMVEVPAPQEALPERVYMCRVPGCDFGCDDSLEIRVHRIQDHDDVGSEDYQAVKRGLVYWMNQWYQSRMRAEMVEEGDTAYQYPCPCTDTDLCNKNGTWRSTGHGLAVHVVSQHPNHPVVRDWAIGFAERRGLKELIASRRYNAGSGNADALRMVQAPRIVLPQ